MNRKQIILAVFALDFLLLTAWAIVQHGYLGIFAHAFQNSATILLAVDLVLAIVMIAGWMWVDANRHGLRVWPYLLVTALFGSAGPLLYLIRRESALKP
ncbi:MAG TPA: DUF2834 domain-containing protein [Nannocystis sp.]|jgi:hypothetical protein